MRALTTLASATALTITSLVMTAPAEAAPLPVAPPTAPSAPSAPELPEPVTADALPTTQIDGVAWTQEIVGDVVFVGGEFTTARPAGAAPGASTSPRSNILSYTLSTGALRPWNPGANGMVRAITASPDGSTIYVGGSFTQIAGQSRNRLAAFNASTGALLPWNPGANAQVMDIAVSGSTVWAGGSFTSVSGIARTRVAAFHATTGAVLPFTADVSGGHGVRSVVVSPAGDKVVIGGSFEQVNSSTNPGRGMAALNSVTGASMPWAINGLIRNGGDSAAIYALSSDDDSVYGTGYDYLATSEDGYEGTFRASWEDGSVEWIQDCLGDDYGVAAVGDVVYTASHDHACESLTPGFPEQNPRNWQHSMAMVKEHLGDTINRSANYRYEGQPMPRMLDWFPHWGVGQYTGAYQAAYTVTGNDDYVLYAGEFQRVNGVRQQGLVRFTNPDKAPNLQGPTVYGANWKLTATSPVGGMVQLAWQANFDRDDAALTYEVFRRDLGTSTPIFTTTESSWLWTMPQMGYTDATTQPGTAYEYRVRATDPDGNTTVTEWTPVTTGSGTLSDYSQGVLADNPRHYWPLTESGATAADWGAGMAAPLTLRSATRRATGPHLAESSHATLFRGSTGSYGSTRSSVASTSDHVTLEAWFTTSSTRGGKIVGIGSSATNTSNSDDRLLYLDNAGRVTFGVMSEGRKTLTSSAGLNDGQWHHVVGTVGPDGMTLFVDGQRVTTRSDVTEVEAAAGYWHVGGDRNVAGWPNLGSSGHLAGTIADVAVYGNALAADDVTAHWEMSGRQSPIPAAPSDPYGAAVYGLDPTLYWRLGEASGTNAADSGRDGAAGRYVGAVTHGQAGALVDVADTGVTLAPTRTVIRWNQTGVVSNRSYTAPATFAVESWFQTTSTTGGKIVGFGNRESGLSTSHDRHVYMDAAGRVIFGVYNGAQQRVQSEAGFNDGEWHHVVAQLGSAGMQLFVDGELVGSSPNTTAAQYAGFWRAGGDSTWAGNPYFRGSLDEVAIYGSPLSAGQVAQHYALGTAGLVNEEPTARFTSVIEGLAVSVDGSVSDDPDGEIARYAWDFGDGGTATGATASHTYAAAGSYEITLTVTDDDGATGSSTQTVEVDEPPPATGVLAQDTFERSVTGSWGTADVGGAWTVAGPASGIAVGEGAGLLTSRSNSRLTTTLPSVSSTSTLVTAQVSVDNVAAGHSFALVGRQVGTSGYAVRLDVQADGQVRMHLLRGETAIGTSVLVDLEMTPTTSYTLQLQVTGATPTSLAARVFATGSTPPDWQRTATDSTAALQAPGAVGVYSYVPTSAGVFPLTLAVAAFEVTDPAAAAR